MKRPLNEIIAEIDALDTQYQGKLALHVKLDGHYIIRGFAFNACTDKIDVAYVPYDGFAPTFTRDWAEFCDGRFVLAGGEPVA